MKTLNHSVMISLNTVDLIAQITIIFPERNISANSNNSTY